MVYYKKEIPKFAQYFAQTMLCFFTWHVNQTRVSFIQGAYRLFLFVDPGQTASNTVKK